jgi:hypothetical protein
VGVASALNESCEGFEMRDSCSFGRKHKRGESERVAPTAAFFDVSGSGTGFLHFCALCW